MFINKTEKMTEKQGDLLKETKKDEKHNCQQHSDECTPK